MPIDSTDGVELKIADFKNQEMIIKVLSMSEIKYQSGDLNKD